MDRMRGVANAVLLATLVKPLTRRMVEAWRKRARESAAASFGIPMQGLLEVALVEELAAPGADPTPSLEGIAEASAGAGTLRMVLIAGAAIALSAIITIAVTAVVRRRRRDRAARAEGSEWVAVPMGAPAEKAEAVVTGDRGR